MNAAERLDEIEARATAATEGPWFREVLGRVYVGNRMDGRTSGLWQIVHSSSDALADLADFAQERELADAVFIAASRTDVPALVSALRAVLAIQRRASVARGNSERAWALRDLAYDLEVAITNALGGTP